jgi:WD40 repeat protein
VNCPFLGLKFFDEADSYLFFGRDEQVADLITKLRDARFVTVIGSSGSGKSSLVRAGLIAALRSGHLPEAGSRWRFVKTRPGENPIGNLVRDLRQESGIGTAEPPASLEATIRHHSHGIVAAIAHAQLAADENVLIVVDQFEEIFRWQGESKDAAAAVQESATYVRLLLAAAAAPGARIYVVLTMRSDFLGNCSQFLDLPERINHGLYLIPRMRGDQLREAIEGPALVAGAEFSQRVVQEMLNQLGDSSDRLPVLQHALRRAWREWEAQGASGPIDLEHYEATGGLNECLNRHSEAVFLGLTSEQQRIAEVLFRRLTEQDARLRKVRRRISIEEGRLAADGTTDDFDAVVRAFADEEARLILTDNDLLDITHESLIAQWRRLDQWTADEAEAGRQLQVYVTLRSIQSYLQGEALDKAVAWRDNSLHNERWSERYGGGYSVAKDWVDRSREERDRRAHEAASAERAARRRLMKLALVSVIVALAFGLLTFTTYLQYQNAAASEARAREAQAGAEQQRVRAEREAATALAESNRARISAQVAITATGRAEESLLTARTLQQTAERQTRMYQARELALKAARAQADRQRQARLHLLLHGAMATFSHGAGLEPLVENDMHNALIEDDNELEHGGMSFNPLGTVLALANEDHAVWLWQLAGQQSGQSFALRGHSTVVHAVTFSPVGNRLASGSGDGEIKIWNVATGIPELTLGHRGPVYSLAYSPDGRHLVSAGQNRVLKVWDSATGKIIRTLSAHRDAVNAVTVSPDGRLIASVGRDDVVIVWDAVTGQRLRTLEHPGTTLNTVTFSPDSKRIASGGQSTQVIVWDAQSGERLVAFGPSGTVESLAFSPDGTRLAVLLFPEGLELWDPQDKRVMIKAPISSASSVSFSPDGRSIAMRGASEWQLLDLETGKPLTRGRLPSSGLSEEISALTMSRGDSTLITGASDGVLRAWDTSTRELTRSATHGKGPVTLAESPDGHVASGGRDGFVRIWNKKTLTEQQRLSVGASVLAIGVRSAGREVVVATDKSFGVWDLVRGAQVREFRGHEGSISELVVSRDGKRVVSSGTDGTVRVWDANTGRLLRTLTGHKGRVTTLALNLAEDRIASGGLDGTVRIWDARSGRQVKVINVTESNDSVDSVAFSVDGRRVAATNGRTIVVFGPEDGETLLRLQMAHNATASALLFSPDGRFLIAGSSGSVLEYYPLEAAALIEAVSGRVFQPLSERDCQQYFSGTCPAPVVNLP